MRSTELMWTDNTSFKRFVNDLAIAERCVLEGGPGPEIKVADTRFDYFSSCRPYKSSDVGTAVNDLDAPAEMEIGGNVGRAWTRVLHYHYITATGITRTAGTRNNSILPTDTAYGSGSTTKTASLQNRL